MAVASNKLQYMFNQGCTLKNNSQHVVPVQTTSRGWKERPSCVPACKGGKDEIGIEGGGRGSGRTRMGSCRKGGKGKGHEKVGGGNEQRCHSGACTPGQEGGKNTRQKSEWRGTQARGTKGGKTIICGRRTTVGKKERQLLPGASSQ